MTSAEQAIYAVLFITPVAIGLFLFGRWSRGELTWPRDGIVVVGTVAWSLVLVWAFAGPIAATLLVPPAGLVAGGIGLLATERTGLARIAGFSAVSLGVLGLGVGIVRLVFT
jgi:hypothetical protein